MAFSNFGFYCIFLQVKLPLESVRKIMKQVTLIGEELWIKVWITFISSHAWLLDFAGATMRKERQNKQKIKQNRATLGSHNSFYWLFLKWNGLKKDKGGKARQVNKGHRAAGQWKFYKKVKLFFGIVWWLRWWWPI